MLSWLPTCPLELLYWNSCWSAQNGWTGVQKTIVNIVSIPPGSSTTSKYASAKQLYSVDIWALFTSHSKWGYRHNLLLLDGLQEIGRAQSEISWCLPHCWFASSQTASTMSSNLNRLWQDWLCVVWHILYSTSTKWSNWRIYLLPTARLKYFLKISTSRGLVNVFLICTSVINSCLHFNMT